MKRFLWTINVIITVAAGAIVPTTALGKASTGRFVVAVDSKTVYDNRTKLTWQRDVPGGTYTWANAKTYCSSNTAALPGTGWRLPGIRELLSIVDRKQKTSPAIDPAVFPNTPAEAFWSASPFQGGSSFAWYVDFIYGGSSIYYGVTHGNRVRCVR